MASMLVFSTSRSGRTTSKNKASGINAASSSQSTSPPDPRNVLLAAGYELTTLRSPEGCRITRISAFDFTMSRGSEITRFTKPLINSSIFELARLPVLKMLCSLDGTHNT